MASTANKTKPLLTGEREINVQAETLLVLLLEERHDPSIVLHAPSRHPPPQLLRLQRRLGAHGAELGRPPHLVPPLHRARRGHEPGTMGCPRYFC